MKDLINDFILHQTSLKERSKKSYYYKLLGLAAFLNFKNDFNENDILLYLNSKEFKKLEISTQNNYKYIIRKFMKFLKMDYEIVQSIRYEAEFVRKENLITKDEIEKFLNNLSKLEYKAIVILLYECGPRVSELVNIRLKDIVDKGTHYVIYLTVSKSRKRPLYLIESVPYLINWLNVHPDKNNPDQYLFCHRFKGKIIPYSVRSIEYIFERYNNLEKRIYPHLLRHSAVTNNYGILNEKELMMKYGWKTRAMIDKYAHLSYSEDLESKILELHGILPKTEKRESLKIIDNKACPRCNMMNPSVNKFCFRCGSVLDIKIAFESENDSKVLDTFDLKSYIQETIEKEIKKKLEK